MAAHLTNSIGFLAPEDSREFIVARKPIELVKSAAINRLVSKEIARNPLQDRVKSSFLKTKIHFVESPPTFQISIKFHMLHKNLSSNTLQI